LKGDRDARLERVVVKRGKETKNCGRCGEAFREWSLRWWVCVECGLECRCEWHPNWGKRGKRREEEGNV